MEIFSKPLLPAPLPPPAHQSPAAALSFLKVGQQLSAQVVGPAPEGGLTLKVLDQLLRVASDLQLAAGTRLELKVELREGQLALRLTSPPTEPLMTPAQGLREVLPRQQPLTPLLEQLARIVTRLNGLEATPQTATGDTEFKALPAALRQAIVSLAQQLPRHEKLATPEGLRQAIANSGMFLEGKLLSGSGPTNLQGDLKVLLFRLAFLLRQALDGLPASPIPAIAPKPAGRKTAPPPVAQGPTAATASTHTKEGEATPLLQLLSRLTESALARIQLNQLTTIDSQQQGEEPRLVLELPLLNGREGEVVKLQIRREPPQGEAGKGESRWSVTLRLESETHGTVRAVVTLAGTQVSTTFWCEHPQTQQLFAKHLAALRERITAQGLEAGRIQSFAGLPPQGDEPERPRHTSHLINTSA